MKVKVLFFGATAEAAGERSIEIALDKNSAAGFMIESLIETHPSLGSHKLLFAVNQEYASPDTELKEGDELAIFTAVSGG